MVYDIKIIPLNEFYLKQTIKLVKSIFKYEKESVSLELKASVDNDEFNKYLLYEDNNIRTLEYFIAINNKGKILGVVGLYSLNSDYLDLWNIPSLLNLTNNITRRKERKKNFDEKKYTQEFISRYISNYESIINTYKNKEKYIKHFK